MDFLLQLMAGQGGAGSYQVSMLQSGGSFFAYAPILRALQATVELPLQEYLVMPATLEPAPGRAGGWGRKASGSVTANCSPGSQIF